VRGVITRCRRFRRLSSGSYGCRGGRLTTCGAAASCRLPSPPAPPPWLPADPLPQSWCSHPSRSHPCWGRPGRQPATPASRAGARISQEAPGAAAPNFPEPASAQDQPGPASTQNQAARTRRGPGRVRRGPVPTCWLPTSCWLPASTPTSTGDTRVSEPVMPSSLALPPASSSSKAEATVMQPAHSALVQCFGRQLQSQTEHSANHPHPLSPSPLRAHRSSSWPVRW